MSPDVIFDEDNVYKRSKVKNESNNEETQEESIPMVQRENQIEENNSLEPMDMKYISKENKKRPLQTRKIIEEFESILAPSRSIREIKIPNIFSSYITLIREL